MSLPMITRASDPPTKPRRQIKAARALLDWSQEELAGAANVSIPTIKRLEAGEGPLGGRSETGDKIRKALQAAGVDFINENFSRHVVTIEEPIEFVHDNKLSIITQREVPGDSSSFPIGLKAALSMVCESVTARVLWPSTTWPKWPGNT